MDDDLDNLFDSLVNYKLCSICKKLKLLSEFGKNKLSKDKLHYFCKECNVGKVREWQIRNSVSVKERFKKWEKENKHKVKSSRLKYDYGITLEIYYEMLANQKGGCAICSQTDPANGGKHIGKYFHVDHCHKTKKVRGLLCNDCSVGLSRFKDDPERLISAAKYIKENA